MSGVKGSDAFGYFYSDELLSFDGADFYLDRRGNPTSLRLASYFPLAGAVLGPLQMRAAYRSLKAGRDVSYCKGVLARGVFETIGCGGLWIIVDIPVTIVRSRGCQRAVSRVVTVVRNRTRKDNYSRI